MHVAAVEILANDTVDVVERQACEAVPHVVGKFVNLIELTVEGIAELPRLPIRQQADEFGKVSTGGLESRLTHAFLHQLVDLVHSNARCKVRIIVAPQGP